jgi:hypothetical protein
MSACICCGKDFPSVNARMDSGPVHFECWNEHHSDPTTEWPRGHRCATNDDGSHAWATSKEEK